MIDRLKTLFSANRGGSVESQVDLTNLSPDRMLMVVGDIHGCENLLGQKLKDADAYIEQNYIRKDDIGFDPLPHVVFVGDYIDRGERSAQVLNWVFELQQDMPENVTCLLGNHERMMIEFLDDPAGRGVRWLRNGGLQTLASYNIGGVRERSAVEELTEASYALEAALPEGLLDWMRNLPLMYRSGNICVVHAAMDPYSDVSEQSSNAMLWGHKDFLTKAREDGLWVVHGHTIVPEPEIRRSRIAIDTGAYHSGKLTLAVIEPGSCTFL